MPITDIADRAAMNALLGGGVSDAQINEYADQATREYLDSQTAPSDTIEKIARDQNLSANHVDRVVESTNVKIYSELLKKASPADRVNIKFPLARGRHIRANLGATALHVKEASAGSFDMGEYLSGPPVELRGEGFSVGFEKAANEQAPTGTHHPTHARKLFAKLASARQEAEGELLDAVNRVEAYSSRFVKLARGYLVSTPEQMHEDYLDACHEGLGKLARPLIEAAFGKLQATGELPYNVKLSSVAPEEYLPDNFPGRVTNGMSQTLKLLRPLGEANRDLEQTRSFLRAVDHDRERMIERVRDLSTSDIA
jgi:hypothetical protein